MNANDLMSAVSALRMQAEALALQAKTIENQLRSAMLEQRKPTGPVGATPESQKDCKCPANARKVVSRPGEPGRTKCTICEKEYEQ